EHLAIDVAQELHRDAAAELEIACGVDHTHAAATELANQLVLLRDVCARREIRPRQRLGGLRHESLRRLRQGATTRRCRRHRVPHTSRVTRGSMVSWADWRCS